MELYCQWCGCLIPRREDRLSDDGELLCMDCFDLYRIKKQADKEMQERDTNSD